METIYISIGQRVEKSSSHPHGWKRVDYVPEDETCVVVLGGSGADSDRHANSYAKDIDELLEENNLKKSVQIYSIVYRTDVEDDAFFMPFLLQKKSREVLLEKYGRKEVLPYTPKQEAFMQKAQKLYGQFVLSKSNPEISDPEYVERLFEKVLLYRISEDNKKLDVQEAMKRIRKLNIVAHCHGAYVFLKLEEIMRRKMDELGYSKKEQDAIQKQLLCVAYAPYAPLGVSKCTMISFCSLADEEVWHQNAFHRELKNLDQNGQFELSYFQKKQGEVMVAPSMTKEKDGAEHSFSNYVMPERELSKEGKVVLFYSQNAILNGVKSSLTGRSIRSLEDVLCAGDAKASDILEKLKTKGKNVYAQILCAAKKYALMKGR